MPTQFFTNLFEKQNAMLVKIIPEDMKTRRGFWRKYQVLKTDTSVNTITKAPSFFPFQKKKKKNNVLLIYKATGNYYPSQFIKYPGSQPLKSGWM